MFLPDPREIFLALGMMSDRGTSRDCGGGFDDFALAGRSNLPSFGGVEAVRQTEAQGCRELAARLWLWGREKASKSKARGSAQVNERRGGGGCSEDAAWALAWGLFLRRRNYVIILQERLLVAASETAGAPRAAGREAGFRGKRGGLAGWAAGMDRLTRRRPFSPQSRT
jgi:hypothetical protein